MLTENQVIKYVSQYLINNGYKILDTKNTSEKGIDIKAIHPEDGSCFVEAKGETSSKKETNRYGKPFTVSQIKTHIGVAILKSFQIKQYNVNSNVFIALPHEKNHIEIFNSIKNCLMEAKIKVIFVKRDGNVQII
jgi:hypothetical protein